MLKRAIVIGSSSGIGAALTRRLVAGGSTVAAVARRPEVLEAPGGGSNRDAPRRRAPRRRDGNERLARRYTDALGNVDALGYESCGDAVVK